MIEFRQWLARAAREYADYPAFISSNAVTYRELFGVVTSVSEKLRGEGVDSSHRVALIGGNSLEYILAFYGLLYTGAIACLLSVRLPRTAVLKHLEVINCRHAILDQNSIEFTLPGHIKVTDLNELAACPKPVAPTASSELPPAATGGGTIFFTSGSSGQPKAVLHSLSNHYYSALGSYVNMPFLTGDRWLLSLPLHHVGGCAILFRALTGGGAVVIPDPAADIESSLSGHRITHLSLVPVQLKRLMSSDRTGLDVSALKAVLVGGAPISTTLVERALKAGYPVHTTYGLTEMASQVTTTSAGDLPNKKGTAGKLLEHRKLKISNSGEILVKGDTLFAGYIQGDSLIKPFDNEGWFATSDLGHLDPVGYLTVNGRNDNMFISGGENIHAEEIEAEINSLENVLEATVVAVPDEMYGQRPVAFVRMAGNHALPEAEAFRVGLSRRLVGFKIPEWYFPMPAVAETGSIKPDRRVLEKLATRLIRESS
ncbi:MAG: o-succinylbenzoate--CoA ligase [Candidatus Zixiibacteriota bacterium]|nr:MAG: o-succinylbenzoate--CoA ligase [candidate division Zixibacteria bacterium]